MRCSYTLIEVMVAVGLLFVIASLIMQRPDERESALKRELYLLKTVCLGLSQQALASGQACILKFDLAHSCYIFPSLRNILTERKFCSGIGYGVIQNALGPPAHPKSVITDPCSFEKKDNLGLVHFYPTGGMSAGAIYLINENRTECVALTNSVSGLISIRMYTFRDGVWNELVSQ